MNTPTTKSLALDYFDNRCAYCEVELYLENKKGKYRRDNSFTLDHFLPRARQGKPSRLNLVPCFRKCNIAKGHLHHIKFTDQPTIDNIMGYFNYVYYLFRRFRFSELDTLDNAYNQLWNWMKPFTSVNRIKVKPGAKSLRSS
jgi:hypothetical protein